MNDKVGQHSTSSTTLSLGSLLDAAFQDAFCSTVPTTAFSAALQSYTAQYAQLLVIDAESMAEQRPCGPDVYEAMMPLSITQTLDACRWHFSACPVTIEGSPGRGRRPTFLPVSLVCDKTDQMARSTTDTHQSTEPPPAEFRELFAVWSSFHPLAPCVEESTLLKDQSSVGKSMRMLIATEARQMRGDQEIRQGVFEAAYAHASQLLRQQEIGVFDDDESAEKAQRELLLACQACQLFAWYELSHIYSKRGMAYIAVIGQLITRLQSLSERVEETDGSVRSQVLTLSSYFSFLTVWAFSQLDRCTGLMGHTWAFRFLVSGAASRPEALLMDAAARICSTLLDGHTNMVQNQANGQLTTLARQLDSQIANMSLIEEGGGAESDIEDMSESLRSAVRLMLLLPSNFEVWQVQSVQEAMLDIFTKSIPRLVRLAELQIEKVASNPTVLAKMPYQREPVQVRKIDERLPMKKTIAAYLYELMAQTMDQISSHVSGSVWLDVCQQLASLKLDLVDSPSLQTAKRLFHQSAERLQDSCFASYTSTPSLTSTQTEQDFSPASIRSAATTLDPSTGAMVNDVAEWTSLNGQAGSFAKEDEEDPLFALLWGFLPVQQ